MSRHIDPEVLRRIEAVYGSRVTLAYDEPPNKPYRDATAVNGPMLRELRTRKGWSQLALQKWSGVAQSVICCVERGETARLRPEKVAQLAAALGVTADALAEEAA